MPKADFQNRAPSHQRSSRSRSFIAMNAFVLGLGTWAKETRSPES